jgi:penicillin-binding protein 1A
MSEATAYITNMILSDTSGRPETWNKYLTIGGRPVAAKTGTSTKQYNKKN